MNKLKLPLLFLVLTSAAALANPTNSWQLARVEPTRKTAPPLPPNCPRSYCLEPDKGWSWTLWCEKNKFPAGWETYPAGLTNYNGAQCICSCFGSTREY
jgi:hypothetical protein